MPLPCFGLKVLRFEKVCCTQQGQVEDDFRCGLGPIREGSCSSIRLSASITSLEEAKIRGLLPQVQMSRIFGTPTH